MPCFPSCKNPGPSVMSRVPISLGDQKCKLRSLSILGSLRVLLGRKDKSHSLYKVRSGPPATALPHLAPLWGPTLVPPLHPTHPSPLGRVLPARGWGLHAWTAPLSSSARSQSSARMAGPRTAWPRGGPGSERGCRGRAGSRGCNPGGRGRRGRGQRSLGLRSRDGDGEGDGDRRGGAGARRWELLGRSLRSAPAPSAPDWQLSRPGGGLVGEPAQGTRGASAVPHPLWEKASDGRTSPREGTPKKDGVPLLGFGLPSLPGPLGTPICTPSEFSV